MRLQRIVALTILTLLAVWGSTAIAVAGDPDWRKSDDALAIDAQVIARQKGVSAEHALRWLHEQETFDRLQAVIETRHETFAGAWTDHSNDNPEYHLLFKGLVPADIDNIAATFDLPVVAVGELVIRRLTSARAQTC